MKTAQEHFPHQPGVVEEGDPEAVGVIMAINGVATSPTTKIMLMQMSSNEIANKNFSRFNYLFPFDQH